MEAARSAGVSEEVEVSSKPVALFLCDLGVFAWYNRDHHHVGLSPPHPTRCPPGSCSRTHAERSRTRAAEHAAHPRRFSNGNRKGTPATAAAEMEQGGQGAYRTEL